MVGCVLIHDVESGRWDALRKSGHTCPDFRHIVVVERESTNIKVHTFTSCGHKHQHVIVWTDVLLQYLQSPHNASKDIEAVKYHEAPTM